MDSVKFFGHEPTTSSKAYADYAFANDGIISNGTTKPAYEATLT